MSNGRYGNKIKDVSRTLSGFFFCEYSYFHTKNFIVEVAMEMRQQLKINTQSEALRRTVFKQTLKIIFYIHIGYSKMGHKFTRINLATI